jgi:hypothetical protein
LRKVGSGSPEVGDGLIVQRLARAANPGKEPRDACQDRERERRWIEKKMEDGLRQGAGSMRSLTSEAVALTNLRGRTAELDTTAVNWTIVVIVDHPDPLGWDTFQPAR